MAINPERVADLAARLGIGHVLAQVLVSRGYSDAARALRFLEPGPVVRPGNLGSLDAATERIAQAVRKRERIAVHGDYDSDGVCSTALLVRSLEAHGAQTVAMVPERVDGYGLSRTAIDRAAKAGCQLLVAVDCGITAVEEVDHARSQGMDVVVVDHHRPLPDGRLPNAVIVHPQLRSTSDLPMCATALAMFLMDSVDEALSSRTGSDNGRAELAAIATVTDVMPLTGVNRSIVAAGLRGLAQTSVLGLAALLETSGTDVARINARTVGFVIGPRLNAAGRVQSAAAALDLLLASDRERAMELAGQLEAANTERRAIQMDVRIAAQIQADEAGDSRSFVLAGNGWHPGVIGIVAGAIARDRHRPTVVLAIDGDEAVGSVRSIPGYDVTRALGACAPLLSRFGGHAAAAGLTIATSNIDDFRRKFNLAVDQTLTPDLLEPELKVDGFAAPSELTLDLAEELARVEPCGEGNPRPLLCVPSVICEDRRPMGNGSHIRFSMRSGSAVASAVAFNFKRESGVEWRGRLDVFGSLEPNEWRGRVEPRFVAQHIHAATHRGVSPVGGPEAWGIESLLMGPAPPPERSDHGVERATLDLTSAGPAAAVAIATACGDDVLAVCADAEHRMAALAVTRGGIDVVDWHSLRRDFPLASRFRTILVIDPPNSPVDLEVLARTGQGGLLLAWRESEIVFARRTFDEALDIESRVHVLHRQIGESGGGAWALLDGFRRGDCSSSLEAMRLMLRVLQETGSVEVDVNAKEIRAEGMTPELGRSPAWVLSRTELIEGLEFHRALQERQP